MRLTVNMRLLAQAAHMSPAQLLHTQRFARWLLDLGDGVINEDDDNITLPPGNRLLLPSQVIFLILLYRYLSSPR
jgi:hypothetical protein